LGVLKLNRAYIYPLEVPFGGLKTNRAL